MRSQWSGGLDAAGLGVGAARARWTVPPIFSSNRIAPIGRSIPKLCRCRSRRGAARRGRSQRAVGGTPAAPRPRPHDLAVAELELDPSTATPAGWRDREADGPSRRLPRAGEDLAAGHAAPAVGVDPSPAARPAGGGRCRRPRCGSRAPVQPRDQPGLQAGELPPARATGSGRSRNSAARDERGERAPRPSRPLRRSAGVGHSVAHQRRFSVARARAPRAGARAMRSRVDAGQLAGRRSLDRQERGRLLGLGSARSRRVVEVAVARVRVEVARPAGQLDAQQRPGVALEDRRAGARAAAAPRASWTARATIWPGLDLQAVAAQQLGERGGVAAVPLTAPAAPGSARPGARAGRRGPSARSSGVPTRKRVSSSAGPRSARR